MSVVGRGRGGDGRNGGKPGATPGARRSRVLIAAALLLALPGADDPTPDGPDGPDRRPFPDPPRQGAPWTPPETALPRFLVSATEALFAQGVADPRGCEYREVEMVSTPGLWDARQPIPARAFVLPAVEGDDRRFAVGWNGLLARVRQVGPEADLAADVRAWGEALREGRRAAATDRFNRPGAHFWRSGPRPADRAAAGDASAPAPVSVSPMQVCLLLRLGRADLAESLFAAATPWTPDGPRPDLTDYGVSYLTLANEWASELYVRGVDAHGRGEDGAALDAFRRLAAFRDQAEATAAALGFPRRPALGLPPGAASPTYFPELMQLDALRADQERRAQEPPRGPIPGRDADPAARVAALILNLDQIARHQNSSPGAASPGGSPLVRSLIAMGDPAVEPLLRALVDDNRLTRSISYGRGMDQYRRVSPTIEAILPALDGLMKTPVPGITPEMRYQPEAGAVADTDARRALAAAYRTFWEANRAVPVAERYYRTLADDTAADRWLGAAGGLAAPGRDAAGRLRSNRPGQPPWPALGEPLRAGRDPSITALMTRRTEELARRATSAHDLQRACEMAATLAEWDTPAALPVLRTMMDRVRAQLAGTNSRSHQALVRTLAQFTLVRARAGDRAALDEYAAWIRTIPPDFLDDARLEAFEPLWTEPDHPAIAEATRALFADPDSPWRPLTRLGPNRGPVGRGALETTPLIRVPAFREAVLAELGDETEAGTIERRADQPEMLAYEIEGGQSGSFGAAAMTDLDALPVGEPRPLRVCDWLAWRLAGLDGTPRFELSWPEPRRDEAITALAAFLDLYGDRYEAAGPQEQASAFESNTRLAFPTLDRPATAADVEAGRAIFSLEGAGGEVRVVPLPEVPLRAAWATLEDSPRVYQTVPPTGVEPEVRHDFDRSGRVWQAEEVRVGDRWERFFGFVGASTVGRAPAEEVEFSDTPYFAGPTGERFGVRVALLGPPPFESLEAGWPLDTPLVLAVHLKNRRGLDQDVPTEFVRPADDGQPALRSGITLRLWRTDIDPLGRVVAGAPREPKELAPTREARFTPGDATRTLGPAEEFEAFRLDLRDWFDLARPGQYRLAISFGDESGLGPDNAGEFHFRLGDVE